MNDFNARNSAAITWLRFPLIFLVILLHGYSVVQLQGMHPVYFGAIYPLALWLGETGVPGFFFISGYLFFLSQKSYLHKLQSRFHSLFIPYILWNTLLIVAYILAYITGHPQDINGRSMADYNITDYLRLYWDRGTYDNGNFVPILCPYWYIRNLLLLSLLSPIVWCFVKYLRELFLLGVTLWWFLTPHNAFVSQSILFFSLGAWFSIHHTCPLQYFIRHKAVFILLCAVSGLADIIFHTLCPVSVNLQIHRLALIANIPVLFILADYLASRKHEYPLLANAAFIVFSIHYPIIVVLRKACVQYLGHANDAIQILLYLSCIIVATVLSLLFYMALSKFMPRLKNILSGNRS